MLRCDFKFLEKAESSSRQQAQKDLINAFNRYYNPKLKSQYLTVGIDIGCSELAVLSNGEEILNLDLKRETDQIIKYQKNMTHHQPGSIRHQKAQRLHNKWWKKTPKQKNGLFQ